VYDELKNLFAQDKQIIQDNNNNKNNNNNKKRRIDI